MSMEHCAKYCAHATLFRDKKLLSAVAQKCSEPSTLQGTIIEQDPGCLELIRVSDERLWLKALKKNDGKPNPSLSLLVALFVDHHHHVAKDLSADSFAKLTRKELLPVICWKAALHFLVVDHAMALLPSSSSENKRNNDVNDDDGDDDELSSLQEQCIEVIVSSWQDLDSANVTKTLRKLSPVILSEILTRLVKQTKKQQHLLPSSITVTGAGTAAVNGVYVRSDDYLHRNAPCFTMRAHWNGSPAEFKMYLSKANDGFYYWRIAVDPPNGNGGKIRLYLRKVNKNDSKLPPTSGWRKVF